LQDLHDYLICEILILIGVPCEPFFNSAAYASAIALKHEPFYTAIDPLTRALSSFLCPPSN